MSRGLLNTYATSIAPADYITPPWPSLYWPFPINGSQTYYLYHVTDIWRFTFFWTLLFFAAMHLSTAGYGIFVQLVGTAGVLEVDHRSNAVDGTESVYFGLKGWRGYRRRNFRYIWILPLVYLSVGGIEAVIAGSVVGGLLGGVYNAGYFKMSTWIPFVWALINSLIIILSSFAIQGGL